MTLPEHDPWQIKVASSQTCALPDIEPPIESVFPGGTHTLSEQDDVMRPVRL
jgi:hypothetical protein